MNVRRIAKNSFLPSLALIALPALLFAQNDQANETTRITVLETGEIRVSGDFLIELSVDSSYTSRGAMGRVDERSYILAGDVRIDDSGFTFTAERGRINPDTRIFSEAQAIVISTNPVSN